MDQFQFHLAEKRTQSLPPYKKKFEATAYKHLDSRTIVAATTDDDQWPIRN